MSEDAKLELSTFITTREEDLMIMKYPIEVLLESILLWKNRSNLNQEFFHFYDKLIDLKLENTPWYQIFSLSNGFKVIFLKVRLIGKSY